MNKELYNYYIIDRKHEELRTGSIGEVAEKYSAEKLSPVERMVDRFERMCAAETPHIVPFEKIVMMRTVPKLPDCFTEAEWAEIRGEHYIHEIGYVSNLSPNYAKTIASGLLARREEADEYGKRVIDAIIGLSDRYLEEAKKNGRDDVVEVLTQVPRYGARNFREALQFFRILHYSLWLEGDYHNTVGRFDVYMYPYFKKDMDAGVYTKESALDLIEDFFISFNKDSNLYFGQQQGDNGQSMVLGGIDKDGNDVFSELSELCLIASRNLKVIDPKINLRVSSKTPLETYKLGTELTRAGLGFPQYLNDDIIIKGLLRLGYEYDDAVNYAVAACWEPIIPYVGNDVANIGTMNFPAIVDKAVRNNINAESFDEILGAIKGYISEEMDNIAKDINNVWFVPSPMISLLMDEKKYNNFGVHGIGIASAADALAAVKKYVFDEKKVDRAELIKAMDENYENSPELLHLLRFEAPKMGTDNDEADSMAKFILDTFAASMEGRKNSLGGTWRAGTGTAMFYLWHAGPLGATADGRFSGESFGTNYSPSLFAQIPSPMSVVKSFTKPDLYKTVNGGPLTLEFVSSIFNSEENLEKVASLVKYFVDLGGHQLQLNAVNLDAMKEAQKDPERYRQLVVRIWGWSAYFVELDKEFQDHVMARQEYSV